MSSSDSSLFSSVLPADVTLNFAQGYDPSNLGRQDDPNYESWYVPQLRKECSRRTLKPPQNLRKAGLIQLLRDHDRTSPEILAWYGRQAPAGAVATAPRRTPHCAFRLLNVLFSDEFSVDFASTGDTLSRAELDDVQSNRRLSFWERLAIAYRTERDDCRALVASDDLFGAINPGHIVPHEAPKLRAMWQEINQGFVTASNAFRQSGTHDAEFRNFVRGRGDVLYLWHWLQVKPQLSDFVHGGLLEEDQYDSLAGSTPLVITVRPRRPTQNRGAGGREANSNGTNGGTVVSTTQTSSNQAPTASEHRSTPPSEHAESAQSPNLPGTPTVHREAISSELPSETSRQAAPTVSEETRFVLLSDPSPSQAGSCVPSETGLVVAGATVPRTDVAPETRLVVAGAGSPPPNHQQLVARSPQDSTPGRNLTPRSSRRNRKVKAVDAIRAMARSVATYMNQRQSVIRVIEPSTTDRVASFQLLDRLRSQINDIQGQLETATSDATRERLQEDLDMYLRERQHLMSELNRD